MARHATSRGARHAGRLAVLAFTRGSRPRATTPRSGPARWRSRSAPRTGSGASRGPRVPVAPACSRRCCWSRTPERPRPPAAARREGTAEPDDPPLGQPRGERDLHPRRHRPPPAPRPAAGMTRFTAARPIWGNSQITARDQTRFFLHIDTLLPRRHRAYGLQLLRTIVPSQRWGIGRLELPDWRVYFKGGWGSGTGARRPPGRAAVTRRRAHRGRRPHRRQRHPRHRQADARGRLPPPSGGAGVDQPRGC